MPPAPSSDAEARDDWASDALRFPCSQCGASLVYTPGTTRLNCPYCRHDNEIPEGLDPIKELDYRAYLSRLAERSEESIEVRALTCGGCTAELDAPDVAGSATAFDCPFCGHAINTQAHSRRLIKPRSLLPFSINREQARAAFSAWLKSRWFLPTKLLRYTRQDDKLDGVYLPYWTFDSQTHSDYRGQRGEYYWENQSYTERVNGKTVRKTRRVRKTRWWPASGSVAVPFDDVLVPGFSAESDDLAHQLGDWDLANLVPFDEAYLAGFRAEIYQVELPDGFEEAKAQMEPVIRSAVCSDIGGDEQRIHGVDTRYHVVRFKHLLMPVWASAYRWKGRTYRFAINGRTGRVVGRRPYSGWKILRMVLVILGLLSVLVGLIALSQGA
ncbi:MAG: hypothetical protein AAF333_08435 [Planctomycetota bacterium]